MSGDKLPSTDNAAAAGWGSMQEKVEEYIAKAKEHAARG